MNYREWLARRGLDSLKINRKFLELEWKPQDSDRKAAWDLYVDLLTRVAIQPLPRESGDEQSALDSLHELFQQTRNILHQHGPDCGEFVKLAIPVLNQVVRPFTAKWHKHSLIGAFSEPVWQAEFRNDLDDVQKILRRYAQALAEIAEVNDLTDLEITDIAAP